MGLLVVVASVSFSVAFFIFTYYSTVGATWRKARLANKELEDLLFCRVVMEGYIPSLDEIRVLIEGKAREYQIKHSQLQDELHFVTIIYTRVVENNLIKDKKRINLMQNLSPLLQESRALADQRNYLQRLREFARMVGLVIVSAGVGWLAAAGLLMAVYEWEGILNMSLRVLGPIGLLPLLTTVALAWMYRIRSKDVLLYI
ncbi:hypothetical protein [Desmospora activa]|uniref:Uncharacterized protein n=1 Tax=Desmospora activa DSM 45169 TaxID=1121389 RepID=A0A2T4ZBA0_9BACL|nr:hypothetical protein [Desmospora activa]PTM59160.1 hypothetical protein C8J48_1762 [Desmospora activa DSM 45169]